MTEGQLLLLIAKALEDERAAVYAECAKIARAWAEDGWPCPNSCDQRIAKEIEAAAIRAKGKT
jgi:hypothetical protein